MRNVARAMVAVLAAQGAMPAWAQSTPPRLPLSASPAAPSGQRPLLDAAGNGVPIVLIAPPSRAGVSRNQYSQFNVNANGLILNNSTGRVATAQAGWIAGNPQLGAPARIIVNEVAGAAPSRLLGTIEVAGRRADIVVANPNGITCDGCGFLNTGRASLTTGAPQFDGAGGLRAFDVRRGELTIGGNGLNAANLEQLDLIARGMVFEGEVWATNLAAIAGANHVMYDSLRAAAQPGAGPAPRFAVDVKDLGGMFAGQVYLLATEQGLGVNSSGRMAALQGNLELSAGGDLALKDSYARQDIRLASAGGLHLAGQTKSDGATAIAGAGRMSNAGAIDAGAMLAIDAGAMHNQGEIIQRGKQALTIAVAGQADNDGRIFSNGMLAMRAGALAANRGTMQSAGDMALVAAAIALTDARLTAGGHASLNAANGVATTGTRIEAAGNLFIDSAGAIGNTGGDWRAGGKVALQGGSASNAGGIIAAQDGLTVHTHGGQFDNQSGTLDAGTTLTVESGDLLNRGGRLAAREAIGVTAGVLDNAGGAIGAGASVRLATRALDNTAGEIRGAADLNIDAGDAALTNAGGALRAGKILSIRAGDLSNSAGLVQADGSATIQAASVDNRAGQISAASRIAVATDRIDNAKGMIAAGSAVELAAGGVVVNQGGQIVSDGGVTIAAAALDNRSGVISAAHAARIGLGEGTLDNAGGALRGKTSLVLQSGEIRNAAGMLYSGSALAIDTRGRSLDNSNGGTIFAHGHLDIAGAALNNAGGALASETGAIDIALGGAALDNAGGRLLAAVDVRIAAGDLGNRGGAISGRDVRLATGALDNEGGRIIAARNLDGATQALFNQRGLIYAAGDIGLDTQGRSLVNSDSGDGGIIAGGGLAIASGDLDNRGGVIASGGRQSLTAGGVLDNGAGQAAGGRIVSNADSAISVTSLLNERGSIAALGNIGIVAGAGGEIDIDNRGGKIAAGGIATLQARLVDNGIRNGLAGTIDAGGVNIKAEVVENAGGAVRSAGDALIEADIVDNRDGLISARAHLDMRAIVLNNTAGTLVADASVAVDTAILSPGGVIASAGDVSLAIRGDYENTGTVSAGRNLTIDALNIGNDGILTAGDTLSASAVYNLSNRGEISARKTYLNVTDTLANSGLIDGVDTRIEAGNTDNTGRIYGDVLRINGDAIGNRATGTIAARETLLLGAQTLSNTDGGSILSLGDIVAGARVHPDGTVSGEMRELTNASARIEAARDMTLSAAMLHNRNDGLVTGMKRFVQPVNRTLIQPAGSVQKHDKASLGWDPHHKGGTGRHVLPSEAYPFARFGALPKPLSTTTVCTGASESAEAICTSTSNYGPDDAVWALFGVLPPKLDDLVAPALPPISGGNAAPGCMAASTMPGNEGRFTGGACGRYWEERDLYELTVSQRAGSASAALDASISAFNADVQARAFEVWNEYHVEARNITETTIEATRPGQIFAGNTITLAGSGAKLNDNSEIVAGGAIRSSGGSISNIAAEGMRSVSEVGQVRYRRVEHHGGLWNNKPEYEIQYRPWEPIPDAPAMQTFALPSTRLVEFAGNPTAAIDLASNAGGPVRPGAALAQGVTAGTIAAIAAGAPVAAPDHPAPRNAPVRIRQVDAAGSAQLPARIVSAGLSLELPASRLFALHGRPAARHLVETDPRFTRERAFLNSDYFLRALQIDPERQLKRYADGFLEQRMINDQILALTGRRYLSGYADTESEYLALMDAGAAFARQYQLTPGVALSAAQMALLTTDIIWLSSEDVTLADGQVQRVLMPQVFLRRAGDGDLQTGGALIAAAKVQIAAEADLVNSGEIAGDEVTLLAGGDLVNEGGRIRGQDILARAGNDLRNVSGLIQAVGADSRATLLAGRDLVLQTRTIASQGQAGASRTSIDRIATVQGGNLTLGAARDMIMQGSLVESDQDLVAAAGRDLRAESVAGGYSVSIATGGSTRGRTGAIREESTAHQVAGFKAGNDMALAAGTDGGGQGDLALKGVDINAGNSVLLKGKNVVVEAAVDRQRIDVQNVRKDGYQRTMRDDETLAGGNITAGSDLAVIADGSAAGTGNVTVKGAYLSSRDGRVSVQAANDIVIGALETSHRGTDESYSRNSGMLGTKTVEQASTNTARQANGSVITGGAIDMKAGDHDKKTGNLSIAGSSVVADRDVSLNAGGEVLVGAARQTATSQASHDERYSGLFSGGGPTVTWGDQQTTQVQDASTTSHAGSSVASLGGSVGIMAGTQYTQTGSQVIAQAGNIDILARKIVVDPLVDTGESSRHSKFNQSGLTLGVSSAVISAIQTINQSVTAAGRTNDSRMKGMAAATAVMAASDGAAAAPSKNGAGVTISLTVGSSKSESTHHSESSSAAGSAIRAGGNVRLVAEGDGEGSTISVLGSAISAGNTAMLKAEGIIDLSASRSTAAVREASRSSSGGVGIAIDYSGSQAAFGVTANASRGRGNADGSDLVHTNSRIEAGNTVILESGSDIRMKGAVASGKRVVTKAKGDLIIESPQDRSVYSSNERSAGGSVTVGYGVSGSANTSRGKVDADFASVGEQSGIKAGDGGFEVDVKGHTVLKGGVIASSEQAVKEGNNSLTTKTLTHADVVNRSNFDASGFAVSTSGGIGAGDQEKARQENIQAIQTGMKGTTAGTGSASGSATGVAKSGISGGSIVITDETQQKALTGKTSQETIAAVDRTVRSDQESGAVAKGWDGQQLKEEIGAQAQITAAFGQGAAKQIGGYAGTREKEARVEAEKARLNGDTAAQARHEAEAEQWKEGGALRTGLHAVTGALTGGVQGAAGAAASAVVVTEVEKALDKTDAPEALKKALQQVIATGVGGVAGGVAGAASGLNVEANNRQLHPNERKFIDKKSTELAANTCKAGDVQCANSAQRYWNDQLTAEAEAADDSKLSQKRQDYLKQVFATGQAPGLEGQVSGGAAKYLDDAQIARNALGELRDMPILGTDGKPIIVNGAALTYFGGTDAQRNDHNLYLNRPASYDRRISDNGSADSLVSKQELMVRNERDATRLDKLSAVSGSAIPDYTMEDIVLGGVAQVGKTAVKAIGARVAGKAELAAVDTAAELPLTSTKLPHVPPEGGAGDARKIANAADNTIIVKDGEFVPEEMADVPGRVQHRINLQNKSMEHLAVRHLSGKANASQFSITLSEVGSLLQSKLVVGTPVSRTVESREGLRYIREINVGRPIGFDKFNGNQATSVLTVMTDYRGNLVTAFPGKLND